MASGIASTIGGGFGNNASGVSSTIGGGGTDDTTVGSGNTATGNYSTIGGGISNLIGPTGDYSTIGGGQNNTATGFHSTIPGGISNVASGNYSFAAGESATASHDRSVVFNCTSTASSSPADDTFTVDTAGATGGTGGYGIYYRYPPLDTSGTKNALGINQSTGQIVELSGKTFVINHPLIEEKFLVHACLEGPEAGVYYRGTSEIKEDRKVVIQLPEYVDALAHDFTVNVTAIHGDDNDDEEGPVGEGEEDIEKILSRRLVASRVRKGGNFTVYGDTGKFHWVVFGKRHDIVVEPDKESVVLEGDGPYKWISQYK